MDFAKSYLPNLQQGNNMKSIIGKLINKQQVAAATDLTWLAELNKADDILAIEISTQRLKACMENDSIRAAERLKYVLAVNTENRERVLKIDRQFVQYTNLRPELESRTAEAMYFYHRQIFNAYRSFIERLLAANGDDIFTYNRLPVTIGRALNAAYSMSRWRYYRQLPAADITWTEIYALYRILERESLLDLTVPIYRDEPDISLGAAFVHACMLDTLSNFGLSKLQMDMAFRILQRLLPHSSISKHYDEKRHLFYVDLSGHFGARRIRLNQTHPDYRYWDTDHIVAQIDKIIQAIQNNLAHNLTDVGKDAALLEVLVLMQSEWSKEDYKRQRRIEERRQVIKQAIASYGFQDVSEHLKDHTRKIYAAQKESTEHTLDDKLIRHHSLKKAPTVLYRDMARGRWDIIDESENGVGVVFRSGLPESIKTGKLVGLVVEDQPNRFMLGSIQSIKKSPNGKDRIGIRIMSRHPNWVQIRQAGIGTPTLDGVGIGSEQSVRMPALYIPNETSADKEPSLLIPKIEYLAGGTYQLYMQSQQPISIRLTSPISSKDDWIQVKLNQLGHNP